MKKVLGMSLALILSGCATTKPQGSMEGAINLSETKEHYSKYWVRDLKRSNKRIPKRFQGKFFPLGCMKFSVDINSNGEPTNLQALKIWPEQMEQGQKDFLRLASTKLRWKPSKQNLEKRPVRGAILLQSATMKRLPPKLRKIKKADPDVFDRQCY